MIINFNKIRNGLCGPPSVWIVGFLKYYFSSKQCKKKLPGFFFCKDVLYYNFACNFNLIHEEKNKFLLSIRRIDFCFVLINIYIAIEIFFEQDYKYTVLLY